MKLKALPLLPLLLLSHLSAWGELDGRRAYGHVVKLVSFGPRPPASPGIERAQEYIIKTLRGQGITVVEQPFIASTPIGRVRMKNIIGIIPGARPEVIILASHYDTKRFEDFRFVGANDGGSSTGLLLELGRVLSKRRPAYTIWLVFFDGEEALVSWSERDSLYGSRYMVQALKKRGELSKIKAMILLDMVGDKDLDIRMGRPSTPWLTDLIWRSARRLGYSKYFLDEEMAIEDDHIPFLKAGVPATDIIDFNYKPWHTPYDTLDKINPESLKIVGDVVLESLAMIR